MWLCEPTAVTSPSPVALWMVTYSRKVLWPPISRARQAALPFQVLRLQSDAGEGKNLVAFAQHGVAVNHDVRMQPAIVPQHHVFADDTVRPDDAAGADLGFGVDHGIADCGLRIADLLPRRAVVMDWTTMARISLASLHQQRQSFGFDRARFNQQLHPIKRFVAFFFGDPQFGNKIRVRPRAASRAIIRARPKFRTAPIAARLQSRPSFSALAQPI